jgi:hypothetical protein
MANPEATFRVVGNVVRSRVARSGKAAWVTVDVADGARHKKIEMVAFRSQVSDVGTLKPGQDVEIDGALDMESLKTKAGDDVKIDGYAKWVPMLVVRSVIVSGATASPARADSGPPSTPAPGGWEDGDIPF